MTTSVEEILPETSMLPTEAGEAFYMNAEFWVTIAFILVVMFLFSPIAKVIKNLIHKRIERIKQELADAESTKLEAQKLYAATERQIANIDKEIKDIIANKNYLMEEQKNKNLRELDNVLQRKKMDLNIQIEQLSQQLEQEINQIIYKKTSMLIDEIISAKLTKKDYSYLIDNSIENIKKMQIGH
jgi:F0F1-type ATP synthase membrane subunit b/b'